MIQAGETMTEHEPVAEKVLLQPPRAYWLVALLTGLITALLAFLIGYSLHQHNRMQYEEQFVQRVQAHGQGIADFVQRSLGAVYTLGTLIQVSKGQIDDFQLLGEELSNYFPGASILALAEDGVTSQVWPLEGNEGELGRDLLKHPERGADAMLALQNKSLTLSSPFYLLQGGRAIAGRLPVFVSDARGAERFWGFALVVINLSTIESLPDIQAMHDEKLRFRLWRLDPHTGKRDQLLPLADDEEDFQLSHDVSLDLANARWVLSVEQPLVPEVWQRALIMLMIGLVTSLALAYSALLVLNMRWQRQNLATLVAERTRSAIEAHDDMAAVIHAVPDPLFELDAQGRYYGIYSRNTDLLDTSFESMKGKTVSEVLPAGAAGQVLDALAEAGRNGWSSGYSFAVPGEDGDHWVELSVARKAPRPNENERFIVLSRDITQRKQSEEQIRQLLARYQSFVSASNTGAWEYHVGSGRLELSAEYFLMLGLDPAEQEHDPLFGSLQVWIDLLHPDDRDAAASRFARYYKNPSDTLYENRFRVRTASGEWIWILTRGRFLRGQDGQLSDLIVGSHIDINDTVRASEELRLVGRVFEQSSEAFLITDARQRIVKVNQAFTQISGYRAEDVLGHTPTMLSSGQHDKAFYQQMWSSIETNGQWQGEVWNRRKDGTLYPEWLRISRMLDDKGKVTHYVAVMSDITQRKADEQHIHQLAYFDVLTGLPNRAMFEERAQMALSLAERHSKQLALMYIDLDNFKNVNDSLGHQVGDALLVSFALRLSDLLREEDTLSRTGGDEFTLILPEIDGSGAAHTAQRIVDAMARSLHAAGHDLTVTASIGIALYPDDAQDLVNLHSNADIAMYRAKQDGRNGYSFFRPELQTYYVRTLQIENALRHALARSQLSVYFQPQHRLADDSLVGAEALLRWNHPELGAISPAEFIPVAENSGLIIPIGEWVLAESLKQLQSWHALGHTDMYVAVNLSAAQFRDRHLFGNIKALLKRTGVPAQALELELTESITMHDPETAIQIIAKLNGLGLNLALDDFGTGYSSMSYLKRFHLQKIKIDQSFIRELSVDSDDAAIVNATITLSRSLGMETLAEGVETQEQRDFLRQAGCDFAQGYLYSRALPAQAFVDYMTRCRPLAAAPLK